MHDATRDEREGAVLTLLDHAHHLPSRLAAELRRYHGEPHDRPSVLRKRREACYVLLDYDDDLSPELWHALSAYAARLGDAMNPDGEAREAGDGGGHRPGTPDGPGALRLHADLIAADTRVTAIIRMCQFAAEHCTSLDHGDGCLLLDEHLSYGPRGHDTAARAGALAERLTAAEVYVARLSDLVIRHVLSDPGACPPGRGPQ